MEVAKMMNNIGQFNPRKTSLTTFFIMKSDLIKKKDNRSQKNIFLVIRGMRMKMVKNHVIFFMLLLMMMTTIMMTLILPRTTSPVNSPSTGNPTNNEMTSSASLLKNTYFQSDSHVTPENDPSWSNMNEEPMRRNRNEEQSRDHHGQNPSTITNGKSNIRASTRVLTDDPYEENDDFQSSASLELGFSFRQNSSLGDYLVGSESDPDYFNVTVPAGYSLMVEIRYNSSEIDFDLHVYRGPSENQFIAGIPTTSPVESVGPIFTSIQTTYYLKINGTNSLNASHSYSYELDVFAEDRYGANPDFSIYNNETTEEDAIQLPELSTPTDSYRNLTIQSNIRGNDTYQFLAWKTNRINLTVNVVSFTTTVNLPEVRIFVYHSNQTLLDNRSLFNSTGLVNIVFTSNISQWYYIRIEFIDHPTTTQPLGSQVFYQLFLEIEDVFDGSNHANNDFTSAPLITNIRDTWTFTGQWASGKHADYFRILLDDAERITIRADFFSAISNINIYLYNDSSMSTILTSSSSSDRDVELIELYRATRAGTHYLLVNSTIEGLRYYNLTITFLSADDEYEENDGTDDAAPLPTDSATYDLFLIKTELDTFVLTLGQGDLINVTITFNGSKGNLNLYLMGGSPLTILDQSIKPFGNSETVQFLNTFDVFNVLILIEAPAGGGISGAGIEYQLIIEVSTGDDSHEPNDSFSSAVPIGDGNHSNLIVRALDEDWFIFYLLSGEQVNITIGFKHALGDIDLYLIDSTNSILAQSVTNSDRETISFTSTQEGLYYLKIQLFSGSVNSYWLDISYPDEFVETSEDNDNFDSAYPLSQGLHENLEMRIGDDDYYTINVTQASQAIVVFASYDQNAGNLILELYHPNGSLLASDELFGTNVDYIPATELPYPDTYYLVVKLREGTGHLTYDLNITIASASRLLNIPPISLVPFPTLIRPTLIGPTLTTTTEGADPILIIGTIGAGAVVGSGVTAGGIMGARKLNPGSKSQPEADE